LKDSWSFFHHLPLILLLYEDLFLQRFSLFVSLGLPSLHGLQQGLVGLCLLGGNLLDHFVVPLGTLLDLLHLVALGVHGALDLSLGALLDLPQL